MALNLNVHNVVNLKASRTQFGTMPDGFVTLNLTVETDEGTMFVLTLYSHHEGVLDTMDSIAVVDEPSYP